MIGYDIAKDWNSLSNTDAIQSTNGIPDVATLNMVSVTTLRFQLVRVDHHHWGQGFVPVIFLNLLHAVAARFRAYLANFLAVFAQFQEVLDPSLSFYDLGT
ncbi:hypothetical protein ALP12_200400 [Pseudomonas savastanoi pv. phaseolicola]|uniref:hypothetical protein n=1 Tax=Pseudomonas savastanoi TaxID=29438 RepID=UPI000F00D127|nr:hypothetical protein [Pseudomonas savastanoi]RMV26867.1 hypothetical protein ALP12_200400 [Pseudomonas savastanoi pv. phaseolicola]